MYCFQTYLRLLYFMINWHTKKFKRVEKLEKLRNSVENASFIRKMSSWILSSMHPVFIATVPFLWRRKQKPWTLRGSAAYNNSAIQETDFEKKYCLHFFRNEISTWLRKRHERNVGMRCLAKKCGDVAIHVSIRIYVTNFCCIFKRLHHLIPERLSSN